MALVLVTRPLPWGKELAEILENLGYRVLLAPLLQIVPRLTPFPDVVNPVFVISSASALLALSDRRSILKPYLSAPCYCVGEKTAAAARDFGFTAIGDVFPTSGQLASFLKTLEDTEVVHICGEDRRAELSKELEFYKSWIVYKAETKASLSPELAEALENKEIKAALFYSPRTAEHFADLIGQAGLPSCCSSTIAIGLSQPVGDVLLRLPFKEVRVALAPQQGEMLACLRSVCPV